MLKVFVFGMSLLLSCIPPVKACDVYPIPQGGMQALGKQIVYPEAAKKAGTEGRVLVSVTVAEDGSVTEMKVVQTVSPELDRAALEAVRKLEWTPGSQEGRPVACTVMLPIQFKLDNTKDKNKDKK